MNKKYILAFVTVVIYIIFFVQVGRVYHQRKQAKQIASAVALERANQTKVNDVKVQEAERAKAIQLKKDNEKLCTFIKETLTTVKTSTKVTVPNECLQSCPVKNGPAILGDCKETTL